MLKVKDSILAIKPYKPGAGKVLSEQDLCKLSANENPLGCSIKAKEALLNLTAHLNRYPDGGSIDLTNALAEKFSLKAEQIICGAGSDEVINMIITAFSSEGDEIIYSKHGFLMYKLYAMAHGVKAVRAEETGFMANVANILAEVTAKTKIVFLANPNNPTGSYLSLAELKILREKLADNIILVVDAAYAEYVTASDYDSGLALLNQYSNVIITRTFSKLYGLAALRLGYALATAEICAILHRVRSPFNVNLAAQIAGLASLKDDDFCQESVAYNAECYALFQNRLTDFGYEYIPSAANFILFKVGERASELVQFLQKQGVFIREVAAYHLPEYVRVTYGLKAENERFFKALAEFKK